MDRGVTMNGLIFCDDKLAVMSATRCGHTNMFHYFDLPPWTDTGFTLKDWSEHHNPIVVLRNPLERLLSSFPISQIKRFSAYDYFFHSLPYMHDLLAYDFRIIDFHDLEQYIPRGNRVDITRFSRTNSRVEDSAVAEDVYIPNDLYSLQELQEELKIYKEFMATKQRISVEEWKELRD